ncbi:MAG: DUF3048 domain-containing protein [Christensenellales bacterium]
MKRLLSLILVLMLLLAAQAALAITVVDPAADRGITPKGRNAEGHFDNNPAIPGVSHTTGLPFTGAYVPVLVNIDNVIGAWPQWGIADADIIYELPIHGYGLTRLAALFSDKYPEAVGPVRSGRVLHAELREEWDAAWAYVGTQNADGSSVGAALSQFHARAKDKGADLLFDGVSNKWVGLYTLVKHHKAPHNHSLLLRDLVALAQGYDFPVRPFLFMDEKPTDGDDATQITLKYGSNRDSYSGSSFVYDAAANNYARSRNGEPYVDYNDQATALRFANVVVQWTKVSFYEGTANRPLLLEVGEGNADIFTGGKHIAGYWVRESTTDRTIFFDGEGNEIRLQRGKTWINVTSGKSSELSYQ